MIFVLNTGGADDLYTRLRDDSDFVAQRAILERLWLAYEPYADYDFLAKLPHEFFARFWEMHLGSALLQTGFQLIPRAQRPIEGPDYCVLHAGRKIWIEAIAPTRGESSDAVPPLELDSSGWVPAEQIVLRFHAAIQRKFHRYRLYLKNRIVTPHEPFIIALNGGRIPHSNASFSDDIPYPIQAVLPFGNYALYLDRDTLDVIGEGFAHRPQIVKNSGREERTNLFFQEDYMGISGIIFANIHPYWIKDVTLQGMSYLHNPCARNRLSQGWFESGREWWIEEGKLRRKSMSRGI